MRKHCQKFWLTPSSKALLAPEVLVALKRFCTQIIHPSDHGNALLRKFLTVLGKFLKHTVLLSKSHSTQEVSAQYDNTQKVSEETFVL